MKAYAVYYSFYAEGVEQRELQEVYIDESKAKSHNELTQSQMAWSGITQVSIEEIDIIE